MGVSGMAVQFGEVVPGYGSFVLDQSDHSGKGPAIT
jgi:hypothetical protein